MAIGNIRERLALAFDGRGSLTRQHTGRQHDVILRFPCQP
jgi:hypothetical protein